MPSNLFPSVEAKPQADVSVANIEAQPVVANVDGESTPQSEERLYRVDEVEQIVKDRLNRERKKLEKEHAVKLQESESKQSDATKKPSANVEEDWKSKLTQFENEKKALAVKLDAYRDKTLKAELGRRLAQHDCLDPELVAADLLHRKLVGLDEDDNLVADSLTGDVDEVVKEYLAKKPYLVKANGNGGVGSKAPKFSIASDDPSNMSREELEARLGVKPKNKLFNR